MARPAACASGRSMDQTARPPTVNARAAEAERRFTMPVVAAALASIPATFLTLLEGPPAVAGAVLNAATLVVFAAEAAVLFLLAEDRRLWVRRHRWLLLVTAATVPAVLLALGPVQVLRLVRVVGALRVLRARRILKAARTLRERAGLTGGVARATTAGTALAAAGFVAVVLADPTSSSRQMVDGTLARFGFVPVIVAGALLGGATFVLARTRRTDR
jgi:CsoR family transcriptional regulator, copper-sensing transcriptional repressor